MLKHHRPAAESPLSCGAKDHRRCVVVGDSHDCSSLTAADEEAHVEAEKARRCYGVLKFAMFLFNGLFWSLGVVTFSLGMAVLLNGNFRTAISDQVPGAVVGGRVFVAAGAVAVITGFLGCCGAVKESRCLLVAFSLVLASVFVALVGAGVWAAASKERLSKLLLAELHRRVANYYADSRSRESMDIVQKLFECCGVKGGVEDYRLYALLVPDSCYKAVGNGSDGGCYQRIVNLLASNLEVITAAGTGIAFVVLLGMVLSMLLCCSLDSSSTGSRRPTMSYACNACSARDLAIRRW